LAVFNKILAPPQQPWRELKLTWAWSVVRISRNGYFVSLVTPLSNINNKPVNVKNPINLVNLSVVSTNLD